MGVLASGDLSQLQQGDGAAEAMKPGELGQLASGGITAIPAGMNITVIEPKAAPGYVEYVSQFLHLISAGIGVPYESMTGDMSGVNMSSARIRRIDFKRDIESMQWLLLMPQLCQRVRAAFYEYAVMAGELQRGNWRRRMMRPRPRR
jgi:capsid protein